MTNIITHRKEHHIYYQRPATAEQAAASHQQLHDLLERQVADAPNDIERMARQLLVLRDKELLDRNFSHSRHEQLFDLFEALMDISDHREDCTCLPNGDACYFCRKVGDAKRILGGEA